MSWCQTQSVVVQAIGHGGKGVDEGLGRKEVLDQQLQLDQVLTNKESQQLRSLILKSDDVFAMEEEV